MAGTIYCLAADGFIWQTWLLFLVMYILIGLGISAGYHRLFTHRSFECPAWMRIILLILAAGAIQHNVYNWSCDHRRHHQFTDTPNDPHDINKGFWYSHFLWIYTEYAYIYDNINDLKKDKWCQWQVKYYWFIAVFVAFVIPSLIAWSWGDFLGGLFIGSFLRTVFLSHVIFAVNSVCHYFGSQHYTLDDESRNNWLIGVLGFGEGYHNYHHAFPYDYRNGVRWFEIDITKWLLKPLSWLGVVKNLKYASKAQIEAKKAEVRAQKMRLLEKDNA
jgi:stearoyl-CoA desaturase (Delta-9 desaturase)